MSYMHPFTLIALATTLSYLFIPVKLSSSDQSVSQTLTFSLLCGPFNLTRTIYMTVKLGLHIGNLVNSNILYYSLTASHMYIMN